MLYRLAFTLVQSVQSVNQTIRVTFLDRMRSAAVSSTSRRSCHYLSNQVEPTSRCIMQQVLLDIAIGRCWYTTGAKERQIKSTMIADRNLSYVRF
ncbi:hypothetical protein T4A_3708 [Trichinella pseudospiralis]|uniref:Uncharacterized protein n=1 Tax=Trichinella pseudospiralis TaxID=6337 RepID=A0A0V1E9W1_TRIPS|nr:hypothetical protein T4A_3708 [Trichinella pseudospiralis]